MKFPREHFVFVFTFVIIIGWANYFIITKQPKKEIVVVIIAVTRQHSSLPSRHCLHSWFFYWQVKCWRYTHCRQKTYFLFTQLVISSQYLVEWLKIFIHVNILLWHWMCAKFKFNSLPYTVTCSMTLCHRRQSLFTSHCLVLQIHHKIILHVESSSLFY